MFIDTYTWLEASGLFAFGAFCMGAWILLGDWYTARKKPPPPVDVDAEVLRGIAGQLERLSAHVARLAEAQDDTEERPKAAV